MKIGIIIRAVAYLLICLIFILAWVTIVLMYTAYDTARTSDDWVPVLMAELFLPFLVLLVPAITAGLWLLSHAHPKSDGRQRPSGSFAKISVVIGIVTLILLVHPMVQSTRLHVPPESAFNEVWGSNWESKITRPVKGPWHDTPWSFWNLILGTPCANSLYSIDYHIPYAVLDDHNTLHVDIYRPTWTEGPIPLIINIHGGSWVYGDKGYFNIIPTSVYLAAQGYLVCDIQYGAEAEEGIENQSTILQEIAHIANFTHWIADPDQVERYQPDLNNVIILGRSAGAHLAAVTVLGYQNGTWPSRGVNFSPALTIRGGILYYPPTDFTRKPQTQEQLTANELTSDMVLSDLWLISPIKLLSADSLPLLILQGDVDTLVRPEYTRVFQQACRSMGIKSVYLEFRYAEHAFDAHPDGVATQISLWATERFLQLALQEGI